MPMYEIQLIDGYTVRVNGALLLWCVSGSKAPLACVWREE